MTRFTWEGGEVSGAWHRPEGTPRTALILGHGAGATLDSKLLVDIGDALAERAIAVVRFNFPYTEAGRKVPDPAKRLDACWLAVASAVAQEFPRPFIGGKSMGGRIASHIAAQGFDTKGLVFLGYPLHPPGKPEKIRDAHLPDIAAPMLWLQGTRDPFATSDLLEATISRLGDRATLIPIQGGDHSFKVSGRSAKDVTTELVDHVSGFIEKNL